MTAIDTNGMTLAYTTKKDPNGIVRVPFEPPLSGYEEVKPRLLQMKVDAEDALGMSKSPIVNEFHVSLKDVLAITPAIALLAYTTYAPIGGATASTPAWLVPGALLRAAVGELVVQGSWALVFVSHSLEAIYTARLCKRHQTGALNAVRPGSPLHFFFPPLPRR
jgi:hypothetical protein